MNYDFGMPQFPGMAGEPYSGNNPGFQFNVENYAHLMDTHQQLPPAPFNLFEDPYSSYQPAGLHPVPPHHAFPAGHPQMVQLPVSGQSQGQGPSPSIFSPPSTAEYTPSNGPYPWSNTPPSASATSASASASPAPLRSSPPSAAVPTHLTQQQQARTATEDQQFGQQDLLEILEGFQQPAIDTFYHPYPQMQGFYPQHPTIYAHTDSNPSPFPGSGDSPPSSLIKPPPLPLEGDDSDDDNSDIPFDLQDLQEQLPDGVTEADLTDLKIPDLNKKLKTLGLSREDQNHVKKIRRQYKNRGYAHTCRKKKDERKNTMKEQKQQLQHEINDLKDDVERLRMERDKYKNNYDAMQQRKQA